MGNEVDPTNYKWVIKPNPYEPTATCFVTNSDNDALEAMNQVVEHFLWDAINPGEERKLTVSLNKDIKQSRNDRRAEMSII